MVVPRGLRTCDVAWAQPNEVLCGEKVDERGRSVRPCRSEVAREL